MICRRHKSKESLRITWKPVLAPSLVTLSRPCGKPHKLWACVQTKRFVISSQRIGKRGQSKRLAWKHCERNARYKPALWQELASINLFVDPLQVLIVAVTEHIVLLRLFIEAGTKDLVIVIKPAEFL